MTFFDTLWQRWKPLSSDHCALHPIFQPDCTACQLIRQRTQQGIDPVPSGSFNSSFIDSTSDVSDSSVTDSGPSFDAGPSDTGNSFDTSDSGFSGFDGGDSGGGGSSGDF